MIYAVPSQRGSSHATTILTKVCSVSQASTTSGSGRYLGPATAKERRSLALNWIYAREGIVRCNSYATLALPF